MSVQILLRRGTAAVWTCTNPILSSGEFGYETDTKKLKIGDGSTAWTSLAYSEDKATFIPKSAITARGQIITGSDTSDYAVLPIGSAGTLITQNPTTGVLEYQAVSSLSSFSDVNVAGATSGEFFTRDAAQWGRGNFSTALSPFSASTRDLIATGVGESGYFTSSSTTSVLKVSYPTDSYSTPSSADLPSTVSGCNAGFQDSRKDGYAAGGTPSTILFKWAFTSDTRTTGASPLAGMANNAAYSYDGSWADVSRGNNLTNVDRYSFSTGAWTTTTAAPASLQYHSGFANRYVAGYMCRGNFNTTVYKWNPAGVVSTTTSAPGLLYDNGGFSNYQVAGYFIGYASGNVYKWAFPTDTVSTTTSGPVDFQNMNNRGTQNSGVAGYTAAGYGSSDSRVYKWSFYSDAVSTALQPSLLHTGGAAFSNSF